MGWSAACAPRQRRDAVGVVCPFESYRIRFMPVSDENAAVQRDTQRYSRRACPPIKLIGALLQVDGSTLQHLIGLSCSMDLQQQCVRGQTTSEIQGLGEWLSTC